MSDTKAKTLLDVILRCVKRGSNMYTDDWYYAEELYNHRNVNHSVGYYGSGDLTTNHIEGFWGVVKHSIMGIYYHWSKKHIHKYINECAFRYNTRDMSEHGRLNAFLRDMEHRLAHKQLIYGR